MPRWIHFLLLAWTLGLALPACGYILSSSATPAAKQDAAAEGPFPIRPRSVEHGLDELRSYRVRATVSFTGVQGGEPTAGLIESFTEVTLEPPALHRSIKTDAAMPAAGLVPGVSEFYRLDDGRVYVKKGAEGAWFTFSGEEITPEDLGFFEPERLAILPLSVSQPPRFATLDGRNVQKYTFDENDLIDPNITFEQAEGQLWLTTLGRQVVRYGLTASLRIMIPNPRAHIFDQGRIKLDYVLSDLDADFTITPPAGVLTATAAFDDIPTLPDAKIITVFPDFLEYTSVITPVDAVLFYRNALAEREWEEELINAFEEKGRLLFSRDGQTATVIVNPAGEDRDRVKISIRIDTPP